MATTRFALLKANTRSPFHVDFDWWQQNENDWHVHLRASLCEAHQKMAAGLGAGEEIDAVDPVTAEVRQVDALQHFLMTHCAQQPDFLDTHTALVDGVFRVLMANANDPMNSEELGARLGKSPEVVLKTIDRKSVV